MQTAVGRLLRDIEWMLDRSSAPGRMPFTDMQSGAGYRSSRHVAAEIARRPIGKRLIVPRFALERLLAGS